MGALMMLMRKPGLSESQSVALHGMDSRERPHLEEHWRSRRRRQPDGPPTTVDGLVGWFAQEWLAELPERLHGPDVWADHGIPMRVSRRDGSVLDAIPGVGGSLLGSPEDTGAWASYLDAPPHLRDDEGDLVRPMRSALAAFRRERPWAHSAIMAVAYLGFDWRALTGKVFYRRRHRHGGGAWCTCANGEAADVTEADRIAVMALPPDVLEAVLKAGLTRLWWLLAQREPHVREV